MQEIDFNGLRFSVPKEWTNQSTLVFAMPASNLAAPLALQKQENTSTANVTIAWEEAKGLTPEDYLRDRMKTLPRIFPGFETLAEDFTNQVLASVQYRVPADTPFIQMVCAKKIGRRMVCVTGTALEASFSKVKEQFLETANSLDDTA